METLKATNQLVLRIRENEPGYFQITTVQYRTFQYTADELQATPGQFEHHDATCPEAQLIAADVRLLQSR